MPLQPAAAPTTWIDVTDLVGWVGAPTGIQRVVTELGQRLVRDFGARTCHLDAVTGTFVEIDPEILTSPAARASRAPGSRAVESSRAAAMLRRVQTRVASTRAGRAPVASASDSPDRPLGQIGDLRHGDHLIVLGANWLTAGYAQHLEHCVRTLDLHVTHMVYDLIPSLYPQWAAHGADATVTPFLRTVLPLCTKLISISEHTQRDLRRFVADLGVRLREDAQLDVITLGSDGPACDAAPIANLANEPFVLCVGTLEIRKNQIVLYQAYREAHRRRLTLPRLVCAGRVGWLAEATAHLMTLDPAVRDRITLLDDVNDAQLRWLYEQCEFTLYPSLCEGWGLPVGESLQYAKLCIASDAASIPEVGGDLVDYASPYDPCAWLDAITRASDHEYRTERVGRIAAEYRRPTWDEAAAGLSALIGLAPT